MKIIFVITICSALFLVSCPGVQPPIGDIGPGGGIIFFAEGGQFLEVSGFLGVHNWDNADARARGHRGGGFQNWRLPTSGELTLLYENLHQKGAGEFSNARYWGTETFPRSNRAWVLNFRNGYLSEDRVSSTHRVRAVRSFTPPLPPPPPPPPPPPATTLTIRNESSHEIADVIWNNVSFTAGANSISPGEAVARNVQAGSGFVRFAPEANPRNLRSSELVVVEGGERREFRILNSTVVVDENNVSDTLDAAVARRTTLTIRNESAHEITHVHWNNISFTSGADSIGPGTSVMMDVQAGSGFVRMRPRLNPFNLRSYQLLIVAEWQQKEFVIFNDAKIVREIDNTEGTLDSVANLRLQIGDIGPGGGTIFFAQGGQFREVTGFLGLHAAAAAIAAAQNHGGGGFDDWRIPDGGDLTLMYENLHREGLGGFADAMYWGGRVPPRNDVSHFLDFSTGILGEASSDSAPNTNTNMRVRAVRTFSVH